MLARVAVEGGCIVGEEVGEESCEEVFEGFLRVFWVFFVLKVWGWSWGVWVLLVLVVEEGSKAGVEHDCLA